MLALLCRQLPTSGPPHNEEISKQLDGDIYEFRKTPTRGPALRVLWFYDEGKIVVCTHGFWKTTRRTPEAQIEKAQKLRREYLLAKRAKALRIIPATW
jgi:phage-related protein